MEFDTKYDLLENLLVQYFYKNFRPLIKLLINEKKLELDSWEKLIWKTIKAQTKAKIQSVLSYNINKCYYHKKLTSACKHK